MHLRTSKFKLHPTSWFAHQYSTPGSSKARGVAILLAKTLKFEFQDKEEDPTGRFLFIKGRLNDQMVTIATLYTPNNNQIAFIEQTLEQLKTFQEGHLIIGADLNYILDLMVDRSNFKKSPALTKSIKTKLADLLIKYDLVDGISFI